MNKVSSPTIYTTQYNNLKGCDFSVSDTEVSRYRSPDSVNMISNDGGNPVKRRGYRDVLGDVLTSDRELIDIFTSNGYTFLITLNSEGVPYDIDPYYEIIKVKEWKDEEHEAAFYVLDASYTEPRVYTYGGVTYALVDGSVRVVETYGIKSVQPYIPEVTIGLNQDGSGGTFLYDVNILTKYRTYSYNFNNGLGSGSQIVRLFPQGTATCVAYGTVVQGSISPEIKVEYLDATTHEWTELEYLTHWTVATSEDIEGYGDEGILSDFKVFSHGQITVLNASNINLLTGLNRDNFRVTFATFDKSAYALKEYQSVQFTSATSSSYTLTIRDEDDEIVSSRSLKFGSAYTLTIASSSLNGVLWFRDERYPIVGHSVTVPFEPDEMYEIVVYEMSGSGTSWTLGVTTDTTYTVKRNPSRGLITKEREDIISATSIKTYGYSSFNRLFFAGGSLGNAIYYTDVDNPTYVPDVNYLVIGNGDNSVSGLHRKGQYLCAIKENEGSEPTMFLINGALATTDDSEQEYFRVTSTSANIGAYNTKCFATLIDDPMFLTRAGIYGISTISTTSETVLRERSTLLNRKLLAEPNLANAVAFAYDMYYFLICPNGHAYVLDGRQATTANVNGNTDFVYEGYYWEGLPQNVVCAYANSDGVMFGTASGRIYKFNTDISDSAAYNDNGQPIHASWSTPMDGDYKPHYLKTMQKKGTMITLEPYERTSCRTTIVKDGTDRFELEPFNSSVGMVDFSNVGNFSYNFYEVASDMFLKKKLKKYKRMQIVVENSNLNEPFGVQEVIKSYTIGSYAKK